LIVAVLIQTAFAVFLFLETNRFGRRNRLLAAGRDIGRYSIVIAIRIGQPIRIDAFVDIHLFALRGVTSQACHLSTQNRVLVSMDTQMERAILAGGCFWGMQELLRSYPGVISTRVGYSGGDVPNATYRNHGTHAEAIEIVFDPSKISYRQLLEFFFQIHDPTTLNRQGNDRGLSYRSAIYYTTDEQRRVAEETIADVEASGIWPGKVVTEVAPAGPFWEAEPEHQDYLQKYPNGYTCHFIRPNWRLPQRAKA
jgi:peptide-methionine (S)-S-oxide reductase